MASIQTLLVNKPLVYCNRWYCCRCQAWSYTIKFNAMKKLNELMQEIILLTTKIETDYPELYQYLDETPLVICDTEEKTICVKDLKKYLETLKRQLGHHIETHKIQSKTP